MSENLKTIKELADEWGITKQTIQYHIKFLPTENRQKNDSGITVLTLEEQRIIKKRVKRKDKNKQTENRQKNDKKDTYYRFVQDIRYNWRKLLAFSASALIGKLRPLQKSTRYL